MSFWPGLARHVSLATLKAGAPSERASGRPKISRGCAGAAKTRKRTGAAVAHSVERCRADWRGLRHGCIAIGRRRRNDRCVETARRRPVPADYDRIIAGSGDSARAMSIMPCERYVPFMFSSIPNQAKGVKRIFENPYP